MDCYIQKPTVPSLETRIIGVGGVRCQVKAPHPQKCEIISFGARFKQHCNSELQDVHVMSGHSTQIANICCGVNFNRKPCPRREIIIWNDIKIQTQVATSCAGRLNKRLTRPVATVEESGVTLGSLVLC